MADVVVTVPKARWSEWVAEGDLPGESWSGLEYDFSLGGRFIPEIEAGDRVYIVAHGRLRGYAPLVRLSCYGDGEWALTRASGAVAVTIPEAIRGFQGFRYRWWQRAIEIPFPDWRKP